MPTIDHVVRTPTSKSMRARQVSAMFDVPIGDESVMRWSGNVDIQEKDWSIGLIVGPSGAGKSTLAKKLFPENYHIDLEYNQASVIDDVSQNFTAPEIAEAFSSVGFSTIPAWLRPYHVLSTGEKFRADIGRRLLELADSGLIVVDEFTSVIDRQVAKITSHAIAKYVRKKTGLKFVAVSCHYDIEEWLQPDWVLEPSTMALRWRCLRRRPDVRVSIAPVKYDAWKLFAPYHYMTNKLLNSAKCYCAFIDGAPAAFAGVIHRVHPKVRDIRGVSRLVTLPDYQGLGLAFVLVDTLGSAYKAKGYRFRTYPAHPALVRSFDRSSAWKMIQKPGLQGKNRAKTKIATGGRPCAVFEYAGPACLESAKLIV